MAPGPLSRPRHGLSVAGCCKPTGRRRRGSWRSSAQLQQQRQRTSPWHRGLQGGGGGGGGRLWWFARHHIRQNRSSCCCCCCQLLLAVIHLVRSSWNCVWCHYTTQRHRIVPWIMNPVWIYRFCGWHPRIIIIIIIIIVIIINTNEIIITIKSLTNRTIFGMSPKQPQGSKFQSLLSMGAASCTNDYPTVLHFLYRSMFILL